MHVIAGTPEVVCLSSTRKHLNWRRRLCQYNPTTILWRYFTIADRRVRAKAWSAADLAASNALFWTTRGWDGSEEMIQSSRLYCLKFPDKPRATIFSKNFVKTVVVTIQGAQAIMVLAQGFTNNSVFMSNIAIDTMFFPLAVLGLLRLFAAPWLTEDYFYAEHEDRSTTLALKQSTASSQTMPYILEAQTTSPMGLIDPADYAPETRFHPVNSWRGKLFRVIFLVPILLLLIICLLYMIPASGEGTIYKASTHLLVNVFYLLFLSVTLITHVYYFIRGRSATTIIPCIVSTWYQIYTCILILLVLVTIVIATLETRKAVCGIYTIWPAGNDEWTCGGVYVNSNSTSNPFGIAMRYASPNNTTLLQQGEYSIMEWDGLCMGTEGANQYVLAMNSSSYAS